MKIESIVLRGWNRDDGYTLVVNGQVLVSANYDEHGSAGIELVQNMHHELAKLANVYPEIDDFMEHKDEN